MGKPFSCSMLAWILFCGLLLTTDEAIGQRKAPNIIIILTDDQGYADVGFNGSTEIPTPGIDRIANSGVVCTSAYVSFAVCGPSRAGLMTGRYQDRFGFSKNPLLAPKDSTMGLPPGEETMAAMLKRAGYVTGALGKWHLGAHPSQHPNVKGFDEFYGFLDGGHRYFPEEWKLNSVTDARQQLDGYRTLMLRNREPWPQEKEYLTDALSREAVDFVTRHKDHPFFLYVAYNAPHAPMQAPEKYLSRFPNIADEKRRTYAAMVSAVDDGVNSLLNALERLHLDSNTLVFYLSDNGGPTKDNASSNKPLRGYKGDFYDGGIRVPFAVQWKGVLPAGIRYDNPVSSLDIFATAAALNKVSPKNPIDGVNLIPYFTKRKAGYPHDALFWRGSNSEKWAIRTTDQKMVIHQDKIERFAIQQDISEQNNLHATDSLPSLKLKSLIDNWKTKLVPPVFLGLLDENEYNQNHPNRFTPKQ